MYQSKAERMQDGASSRPRPETGCVPHAETNNRGTVRTASHALPSVPMDKALWCDECQRYYNPEAPHSCRDREIADNRVRLEKWLGTYTIKEG